MVDLLIMLFERFLDIYILLRLYTFPKSYLCAIYNYYFTQF